jgi:hypothetical protein
MAQLQKADYVFALIWDTDRKKLLFIQNEDDGKWSLPGVRVEANEEERDALIRCAAEKTGFHIQEIQQVGPLHPMGSTGETAKAFRCSMTMPVIPRPASRVQCHLFNKKNMRGILLQGPPVECMVWDGFTVYEEPEVNDLGEVNPEWSPAASIFVSEDDESFLVQESKEMGRGIIKKWRRLDPSTESGYMIKIVP